MEYYSKEGKRINTETYPDYEGTRYINWTMQADLKKRVPVLFERKEDCCGCYACYSICPKEAISMREDLEGFVYPNIDIEKCIKCYKCEEVCVIKNE